MNNAKRGREGAKRAASLAGLQIMLAATDTGPHPMDALQALRSPKAKRRDVFALSDDELDEILAGPEVER